MSDHFHQCPLPEVKWCLSDPEPGMLAESGIVGRLSSATRVRLLTHADVSIAAALVEFRAEWFARAA
ncbi:MAG: hypothetical protein JWQ55_4205 [Rhodopila sp.]|nr:hypothetical protein [Rhodopila sp.]